jgi:hypothetical protein
VQGEIRATAFNEQAERIFPLLERGKVRGAEKEAGDAHWLTRVALGPQVYIVARGTVRVVTNTRYNQVRNNYEILFDANTAITEVCVGVGVGVRAS